MDDLDAMMSGVPVEPKDSYPDEPEVKEAEPEAVEPEPEAETETESSDVDDYGNDVTPKTYTQDEVNEMIRERVARFERNQAQKPVEQQQSQQQAQQTEGDWQAELKAMIENTVQGMTQKQQNEQKQMMEAQAQQAFEAKFHNGMTKFKDFQDVVGKQNITDSMVLATRAMSDPAAFIYAASKKASDDLNRIANIPDPYVQMVEMGRLEGKLKSGKQTTQTPRPLGKVKEDVSSNYSHTSTKSVDDLINESNARRAKAFMDRSGGQRRR